MSEDAFAQLEESKQSVGGSGDYAPWWNEDNFGVSDGDDLIGVVVEKHSYTDPGGDDHPVATVRSVGRGSLQEGEEASTPTRTGIEPFVEETEVGDLVFIEYGGQVKANSGRDMHVYEASKLTQEDWAQTDQADDIREVWESSRHFDGGAQLELDDTDDESELEEAIAFGEDVLKMNGGSVTEEEFEEYVTDIKDFGVDIDEVITEGPFKLSDGDVVES